MEKSSYPMNLRLIKSVFIILLLTASVSMAASVENEFIKIVVNDGPQDLGRFAVETTQSNQPLIFGRPIPWTSYTTVRIDGKEFIFGGESVKTLKRTGQDGLKGEFGKVVTQNITPEGIVTECDFNDVRVIQKLSFYRNPNSRVRDSALISYTVKNLGDAPHKIGVRLMLDTKLGANDGAPFRIGTKAFESEARFSQAELQDYWQTFDSLTSPNVMAQGTLRGEGLTPPDRMFLVNWGTLSDYPWEFNYEEGRSFVRAGELEKDTALALYWDEREVAAGSHYSVKTLYGMASLTLAPGALSLGLAAPGEAYFNSKQELLIVGYVSNTGGYDSTNTVATFDLPNGFRVVNGSLKENIGRLAAGQTRQLPLKVVVSGASAGTQYIRLSAESESLDPNSIQREIEIIAPPKITAEFIVPFQKTVTYNPYFDARLKFTNSTKHTAEPVQVKLRAGTNAVLPTYEFSQKFVPALKAGESTSVHWKVKVKDPKKTSANVGVDIYPTLGQFQSFDKTIQIRPPKIEFTLQSSRPTMNVGDYFYVSFGMRFAKPSDNISCSLQYDNQATRYLRHSLGDWSKESNVIMTTHSKNTDFHFRAEKAGVATFVLKKSGSTVNTLNITISPLKEASP